MRRILAVAAALTLTVAVGSASAHHGGNGDRTGFGHHHFRHHHHGFVVAGTNASFNGTKNADGTYTGDLTLTLKGHHHDTSASAHKSNGTGDRSVTKTFHLDNTAVKFADSVTDANGDGMVDFSDVQPTDVVLLKVFGGHHGKLRSHSSKAHASCHNGSGSEDSGSRSSTPTITKAFVFRPQETPADPEAQH